jgi:hypothetical protein
MAAEPIVFWVSVVTIVVTGVVLWTSRGSADSGWRRVSRIATIALVIELILVVAAVLYFLSFDDRLRF